MLHHFSGCTNLNIHSSFWEILLSVEMKPLACGCVHLSVDFPAKLAHYGTLCDH